MSDGGAFAGPEAAERVLQERARTLARPLQAEARGETVELVVLAVGSQRYGLDTRHVVEVQPLARLARVPGLPAVWAGIVNLRGRLCPVLDLRHYLALPEPARSEWPGKVAVVTGAGLTVGLLVDDAVQIAHVPVSQIGPPVLGAPRAMRGVTPDLVTVVEADDLLADPRLAVGEESA